MGKILILIGLAITGLGLILYYFPDAFRWIGKLHGDYHKQTGNISIHFPLATSLLLSVVLSFLIWLIRRFL